MIRQCIDTIWTLMMKIQLSFEFDLIVIKVKEIIWEFLKVF